MLLSICSKVKTSIRKSSKEWKPLKTNIMSKETSSASGGIGFLGLLAIVFIVLRLCNVIAWSWWWVLAPIWIPVAIAIIVLLFFVILAAIAGRNDFPDDCDY